MFEHAIEPFSKVILDKPSEPIYVHERAKCYLVIQEYEKALSDFNMVLSHQTANQNAYLGRGFTYKALKKYQLAANDFEQAKILDPLNPKLQLNYLKIHGVQYIKLCEPGFEMR
jgi:tetratricopeptide (TPR) repeat protein